VAAARAGDRRALEVLVEANYDRVYALCRRMLGHDADALDATQDALLAAVRSLRRFDGRAAFGTWLYRIAVNTCLDELRRRRRRPVTGLDDTFGAGSPTLWVVGATEDASVGGARARAAEAADPAEIASARVDVDVALRSLQVEFRVAVVLRDMCDLSYEEIASVLDVPVGTVRSRIARGRAAIADRMSVLGESRTGPAGNHGEDTDVKTRSAPSTNRTEQRR